MICLCDRSKSNEILKINGNTHKKILITIQGPLLNPNSLLRCCHSKIRALKLPKISSFSKPNFWLRSQSKFSKLSLNDPISILELFLKVFWPKMVYFWVEIILYFLRLFPYSRQIRKWLISHLRTMELETWWKQLITLKGEQNFTFCIYLCICSKTSFY